MKIFAPYVIVYGHIRSKMILAADRIEKSRNEDRTLITKTHKLSDEILFDFRLRCFQLPVSEKQLTSGLGVETGSRKVDGAKVQVELYTPPKFHANR